MLCAVNWELVMLTCAASRCVLHADPGQGAFWGDFNLSALSRLYYHSSNVLFFKIFFLWI